MHIPHEQGCAQLPIDPDRPSQPGRRELDDTYTGKLQAKMCSNSECLSSNLNTSDREALSLQLNFYFSISGTS